MTIIDTAAAKWTTDPRLQLAFPDLATFVQVELAERGTLNGSNGRLAAEARARRSTLAAARLEKLRRPYEPSPADSSAVERIGSRLVVWLFGPVDDPNDHPQHGAINPGSVAAGIRANRDADVLILRIASHGGRIAGADALIAAVLEFPGRSIAIVDREAFSAAGLVAIAADQTWMRQGSLWMAHRAITTAHGNSVDLHMAAHDLAQHDRGRVAWIASRRRLGIGTVRDLVHGETYLGADEAVRLGIAHRVIHALPFIGPTVTRHTAPQEQTAP